MGSFNDEYLKLRKKRQEEQEEDYKSSVPYQRPLKNSAAVPGNSYRDKVLSGDVDDIAPLPSKSSKEEKDRKWFDKGAFDDGWQPGDLIKVVGGSVIDLAENVGTGLIGMGEKAVDALVTIAPYIAQGQYYQNGGGYNIKADQAFNQAIQQSKKDNAEFVKKDLYNEEDVAKKIVGGLTFGYDYEGDSVFGEKSDALAQSGGQLLGTVGLQALGVPWWLTTGATTFGSEAEGALNSGATMEEAALSGFVSAGAEILTEKISGGISFGGKTLDDALTKELARGISNKTVRTLAKIGVDMAGEGGEEILSGVMSAIGQKLTYANDKELNELFSSEEAFESFIGGAVLGGGSSTIGAVKSNINGVDSVTGLTKDEQAVIDKVYNDRIADEKLTNKEKSKIYDEVMSDFEKGYISTDIIEEVLGGEDYSNYQSELKRQQDIDNELNELRNMKSGDMTDIQIERMAELKGMKPNTELVNSLKFGIDEKIRNSIQGSRLVESYNERARRGRAFEADLSQYDSKQAEVIKKAIDSGILNNTNRTHDFVDMVAKISADKGVLFDFANNAKLKESGFAVDGKFVNGYVTKDGITVNIDSNKALNSIVGHEITHVLEGTELYAALKVSIQEYAKSKGEYQSRLDTLTKLYEGVEGADVNAELTADLVGDYLFTDSDFINHLSTTNRNVFQKIYDEIKYLYKVATAGSKQARELEKVKRAFDKAYRESGKAEGTKYSLSDSNGNKLTKEQADYFKDSKIRDKDGNLLIAYHGTDADFNTFDADYISRDNKLGAGFYFKVGEGLQYSYEHSKTVYLNITNPITDNSQKLTEEAITEFCEKMGIEFDYDANENDLGVYERLSYLYDGNTKDFLNNVVNILGVDGVISEERKTAVAFSPNQVKNIDNTKPTSNPDIRYSLSDSEGNKLTKEQSEYFKDSKMRDENGNLKVMYHGSQDAGFHTFDAKMSDDDTSFFFVDRNEVAASYSGTSETYAPKAFKTVEDANKFFAEIGADEYEVIERDGKYTLLDDGDEVATSDDLAEIYEEWRDWSGLGYGDANYKVYLNLTNPLEIDAKGRPWNKIDAEFSQEVYDKYQSLTAEEKAALVDLAEWEDFSLFNSEIQTAQDNELASAYKKMGEDVNIYDLFSVAADNFSEESMRENARYYLKTRDFAQRAKEQGYDGVIFKNIIDNGGYSSGDEGASTVAIAFESNQIKSVGNDKPTGDKDIRYSLSETDKTYLEAVKRGDMETAQQMVYDAAKQAGYTDDTSWKMQHTAPNSKDDVSLYDLKKSGLVPNDYWDHPEWYTYGAEERESFYKVKDALSKQERWDAEGKKNYKGEPAEAKIWVYRAVDKTVNSKEDHFRNGDWVTPSYDYAVNEGQMNPNGYRIIKQTVSIKNLYWDGNSIAELGYDDGNNYAYRDTVNNRKLLDPVTYDNYGKVIPLSKRFKYRNSDVRYSLSENNVADHKQKQFEIIQETNPMWDDYHTGIRSTNDIRTWAEVLELNDESEGQFVWGDFSRADAEQALKDGTITVYSSYPIKNGVFVSTSYVQAQEYAGGKNGKVYSKTIPLTDVAWINGDEGQYAEVNSSYSLSDTNATPKKYGNYNVYGKDIRLPGKEAEDIAPVGVAENAITTEETISEMETVDYPEGFAPVINSYTIEQELDEIQSQIDALVEEGTALYNNGEEAKAMELMEKINELSNKARTLTERANTLKAQEEAERKAYMDSITDADMPLEAERAYSEAETTPLDEKTLKKLTKGVRDILSCMPKESKAIREVIETYSTSGQSKSELFNILKDKFGDKYEYHRYSDIAEAKKHLKNTKFTVSDHVKGDIADYRDYKKLHGVRESRNALPVDIVYEELSELFPGVFSPEIANETDRFERISEVMAMPAREWVKVAELSDSEIMQAVDFIHNEVVGYRNAEARKAAEANARAYIDDIAPSRASEITKNVSDPTLNYQGIHRETPIKTTREKIAEQVDNIKQEIADLKRLRADSIVDFNRDIARWQDEYNAKANKNTKAANDILRRIERLQTMKNNVDADYEKRISDREARVEKMSTETYQTAKQRQSKTQEYAEWAKNLIGDTTHWVDKKLGISYKVNTLKRNLRDVVRDAQGNRDIAKADAIYDELQGAYNHNEAELNRESNRIKKVFADMKITAAEDVYIQMLGEFMYNPESSLTPDDVNNYYEAHKSKIDKDKVNEAIKLARANYDSLLERVNEVLREQGMKEIPYRKGYFPHFTETKQSWLAKLFNWKTQDTEIPTSIAGLTEQFTPNRSWQSFNKQRFTDATDYSFTKGFDTYVQGALDWIYHIEDIQKRRAFENELRYIHSDKGAQDRIEALFNNEEYDADELQDQIDLVYAEARNPLNNFVTDLHAGTNRLASKKSSMDRGMEELTNRKFYSTMTNLSNRVSANMVGGSVSSALTNFIPITQSWGEVSPISSLRGMGETIRATFKDDGVIDKSDFLTNRLKKSENLYKTTWDKISDKAAIMMEGIDSFTSQTVWRSKYIENISNGMSESEAIKNADQFAEGVMAGRSRGNQPTLFDSKNPLIKTLTAFQLEVNNQYGYMFKDMPQDVKNESTAKLIKGYAAIFIGAYAYNALYSALTGRDAAFDPIRIVQELLGDLFDEDEEEAPINAVLGFAENVAQELPFVGGLLGGGRVPISSALPYDGNVMDLLEGTANAFAGEDVETATKEWLRPLYYLAMPMGGGQLKKTIEGLSMFSDDHPIAGSYTDSGNLRFPVDDTLANKVQAGIFGQWASENARDYFDNERAPLNEKQTQEFIDVGMTIQDYWKYREGLSQYKTLAEKADYINSLDLTDEQKNVLINNIADREEDIDMSDYGNYGSFEEFDYANKYPEKYEFWKQNGISYQDYASGDEDTKAAYNWAYENPDKFTLSKAVADNVVTYRQYTKELYDIKADKDEDGKSIVGSRKEKVIDYVNNLDADYGAKIILFKSEYPADDTYNYDIIDYLNSRDDITYKEMETILKELGFTVDSQGNITWD